MAVSVVVKNACYTYGEGPHWEEKTKSLLFVDIKAGDYHRWNSINDAHDKIHVDGSVSLIVPRETGGYVVSNDLKLADLDWESKQLKPFVSVEPEKPTNRFNDGKCDVRGRLWAGTMGHEKRPAEPEMEVGHLYRLDKDRQIHTIKDKINISNGMTWTADNKTMFYTHSLPRKVFAYDFNVASGEISRESVVVDFTDKDMEEFGVPDGMTIDLNDKIWLACYNSSRVFQIDPETGNILTVVKLPVSKITSCCFGGPNYDDLYVTSSTLGLTEEEFRTKEPIAGSIFKVTGTNAKGAAGFNFQG